eukprot:6185640-Amphidinium_carterae.1
MQTSQIHWQRFQAAYQRWLTRVTQPCYPTNAGPAIVIQDLLAIGSLVAASVWCAKCQQRIIAGWQEVPCFAAALAIED